MLHSHYRAFPVDLRRRLIYLFFFFLLTKRVKCIVHYNMKFVASVIPEVNRTKLQP